MATKKSGGIKIPGVSFSLNRALGITQAKQKFARETGIPTTKSGMERKVGRAVMDMMNPSSSSKKSASAKSAAKSTTKSTAKSTTTKKSAKTVTAKNTAAKSTTAKSTAAKTASRKTADKK